MRVRMARQMPRQARASPKGGSQKAPPITLGTTKESGAGLLMPPCQYGKSERNQLAKREKVRAPVDERARLVGDDNLDKVEPRRRRDKRSQAGAHDKWGNDPVSAVTASGDGDHIHGSSDCPEYGDCRVSCHPKAGSGQPGEDNPRTLLLFLYNTSQDNKNSIPHGIIEMKISIGRYKRSQPTPTDPIAAKTASIRLGRS